MHSKPFMKFKNRYLLALDVFSIFIATVITFLAIFPEKDFPLESIIGIGGLYVVFAVIFNLIFGIYKIAWNYSGTGELTRFLAVNFLSGAVVFGINELLGMYVRIFSGGRRADFVIIMISILLMTVIRLLFKEAYIAQRTSPEYQMSSDEAGSRVLIVGAGDAARVIIANSLNDSTCKIIGLIDDNPSKIGKVIYGCKVLGDRDDIIRICHQHDIDTVIMAIPSAYVDDRRNILEICNKTKCKIKTMPTIAEIMGEPDKENIVREVRIEDLLEREPVKLDNGEIKTLVGGKTVMVTGGGGSIGSELCRQIMRFSPEKLVIVDIYENNAYDIQMELNSLYPDNQPDVLIASIRDMERVDEIFNSFRPQVVFHAAAHKHVPLMEVSPREAVKNNVFGTYNLAVAADKYGVEKFVMISTDKAVNPTNVMGATKRVCEMIIQCMEQISSTDFVAVRFGNVLGSNGSVIPLFKKQIANGGPVKVTHRDVTRFFMTIPEAAQLVIQAACYANGGEIFVLDMGKPVKIYDLAENLIRLSGHTPGDDIKIEIVGLRPGEKLYEELLMDWEGLEKTANSKIFIGRPKSLTLNELDEKLNLLKEAVDAGDDNDLRSVLEQTVPTYIRDNEKFNRESQNAKASY